MTKSKKVVILLVEGISDRELLYEYMYYRYKPLGIKFKLFNGDVFFSPNNKKPIKSRIGDAINEVIKENKFKFDDILTAIHVMDTDGCFIPTTSVIHQPGRDIQTYYTNENIIVSKSTQVEYIRNRNTERNKNVSAMHTLDKVITNKVRYRLFYFSRNLEHVLFDNPNAKENKFNEVELFLKKLNIDLELFLESLMPPINDTDFDVRYRKTWDKIKNDNNSLIRGTNTNLIFQYLDILTKI